MARRVNKRSVLSPKVEMGMRQDLQRMARVAGIEGEVVDDSVPGTKVDRYLGTSRKIPFSMQWFKDHYPLVEVTPEENLPVTINGVRVDFRTDVVVKVPEPFAAEYHRWRKDMRSMHRSNLRAGGAFPEGVVGVIPGAGGLAPEGTEEG